MQENILTERIIGCAMTVHSALGPGLSEEAYQECLSYELSKSGILFEKEKAVPLIYKDEIIDTGYTMDLLVEGQIVVEVKAVDEIESIHLTETLTYLRLTKNRIGLILNFNVVQLKEGIKRVINDYQPKPESDIDPGS